MKSNDITKFLSSDNQYIKLPVPIGSTVYEFRTDCTCLCYKYPKWVLDQIPHKCDMDYPCHNQFKGVHSWVVTMDNFKYLLTYWGVTIFATHSEAESRGKALVQSHREILHQMMRQLGIDSTKPQYIVIHSTDGRTIDLSKLADLLGGTKDK